MTATTLTGQQLAEIRARFEATTNPGWRDSTDVGILLAELDRLRAELEQARQQTDLAYRERAQLTAWLAALHPAVIASAPDVDEPGWQILYMYADGRQLSWHIHPRDAELYTHVEHVSADDPRAQWDGHTTDEKYEAIRAAVQPSADAAPGCGCQTYVHPGHYPSCPERTAQPSA